MRARRRTILFTVLGGVAVLLLWSSASKKAEGPSASPVTTLARSEAVAADPAKGGASRLPLDALSERATLGKPAGALFGSQPLPVPPKVIAAPVERSRPVAPSAPPLPYRFVGTLLREGTLQVFLAKGDVVIPIQEGQVLDGTYRVDAIEADRVRLVYLPLNHPDSIALSYAAHPEAADRGRDETRLANDLERWPQLSREERGQVSESLRRMPPSSSRDRLFKEYARQVGGRDASDSN